MYGQVQACLTSFNVYKEDAHTLTGIYGLLHFLHFTFISVQSVIQI